MKKWKLTTVAFCMMFSLSACGSGESNSGISTTAQTATTQTATTEESLTDTADTGDSDAGAPVSGGNILITYFTVPETDGVDTVGGASRVAVDSEVLGNNQFVAQIIQETIGGQLFEIETVQEYPGSHDALLDFAYEEKEQNARPELAAQIENLDSYDTILIGFPNWNADLPMPLYTFFEEHDFSGKTIIPFTVHGGSGFSRNIQTIAELEPGATVVTDGLSISRDRVSDSRDDVVSWAESLGL